MKNLILIFLLIPLTAFSQWTDITSELNNINSISGDGGIISISTQSGVYNLLPGGLELLTENPAIACDQKDGLMYYDSSYIFAAGKDFEMETGIKQVVRKDHMLYAVYAGKIQVITNYSLPAVETSIELDSANKKMIFCNEYFYILTEKGSLYKSEVNECKSFIQLKNTWLKSKFINDVTSDSEGNIFAAIDGYGIYKSQNEGDNWVGVAKDITSYKNIKLVADTLLFAGFENGFSCARGGGDWITASPGEAAGSVVDFAMGIDDAIVILTRDESDNRKLYQNKLANVSVAENNETVDIKIKQYENYLEIVCADNFSASIYNIKADLVYQGSANPINTRNLPSGTYFISIKTGSKITTKKINIY